MYAYRADIDGLRAVSVLAVVLFHAGMGVTGGFVGVDVFFVISGYLITSLILKQQDAATFRIIDFFSRRVRRIVPAASAMTIATLALGGLFLSPYAWKDLAKSAAAQCVIGANVWFWRTLDYFSAQAELKPLLHTWSLAVEEQFYLIYPFLLIALRGFSRRTLVAILAALALLSLALPEAIITTRPSAAYYLLPFRAWELLVGGLVYFAPRGHHVRTRREAEAWLGLAMVLLGAFLYDKHTRFPGIHALPPCLGASLIIYAGASGETVLSRILSSRPFAGLGILSYSIYLWHWPLLALSRYLFGINLPAFAALGIILLSIAVAAVSWRWVEQPFRTTQTRTTPTHATGLWLTATAMIGAFATTILLGQGFPSRFTKTTLGFFAAGDDAPFRDEVSVASAERGAFPSFGDAQGQGVVFVWGDSHAKMIVPGVDLACRQNCLSGLQATYSATPPLLGYVYENPAAWGLIDAAPRFNAAVLKEIIRRQAIAVILAGCWRMYARDSDFAESLPHTVDSLSEAGIRTYIMLDIPEFPSPVPEALARRAIVGIDAGSFVVPQSEYDAQNAHANGIIQQVAGDDVRIIDPREILTDANGDWISVKDGIALYHDASHLSGAGRRLLSPLFNRAFGHLGLGKPCLR